MWYHSNSSKRSVCNDMGIHKELEFLAQKAYYYGQEKIQFKERVIWIMMATRHLTYILQQ